MGKMGKFTIFLGYRGKLRLITCSNLVFQKQYYNNKLKNSLGKELGSGEFGITYLYMDKETQEVSACTCISKKNLRTAKDVENVRREVAIMQHLAKHPNIVTLKGASEDDNAVHLVMELCEGGDLFDRIIARGRYAEREAAQLMHTIMEVVQTCHRHGVMHRDLKPDYFLFANKNENSPLKAIDFGISVFFKPGQRFSEDVGTPAYMAPEVLRRNFGPEVDVWRAGVILYFLLSGYYPIWVEREQGIEQEIIRSTLGLQEESMAEGVGLCEVVSAAHAGAESKNSVQCAAGVKSPVAAECVEHMSLLNLWNNEK